MKTGRLLASISVALVCLAARPAQARTWIVDGSGGGDFTRVTDACNAAASGDTVAIRPGEYDESVGQDYEIRLTEKSISLIGLGGSADAVRLRLSIRFSNCDEVLVQGITFHDEYRPLYASYTPMIVRYCKFLDNCPTAYHPTGGAIASTDDLLVEDSMFIRNHAPGDGGSIYHEGWTVTLRRCVFTENEAEGEGGAIFSAGRPLIAEGCLFVENAAYNGAAIRAMIDAEISGCTLYRNRTTWSSGAAIEVGLNHARTITHCIVAGTVNGYGIGCWEGAEVYCFCFWQNERGDSAGYCDTAICNIEADPLFCDPEHGDFRISETSPCVTGEVEEGCFCGLVGAYGVGCIITPTETTSWGRIKARYGHEAGR
jgi:predicted outer membrane repeat protein